ncbi:2-C-methyl-D-erythritol 4-phosphate cytidylyltransferase [Tibeticola sp.]|uniref:2-C-methyl-D-erythritol 4-phosphate cytidylyltransferase n=1 Tax=Tibeticola sp. TaxID=2005368 RepID=UPI00258FF28E|nr:2-C-methyl-D-erythritol 4-phosphate cytidylyltransferase [Tibeticola sp.]MCI4439912.1 2-C-methyl-D-erythritol 4-phosphate cytidylyltransferase [Tibeticola sp.]
MTETAPIPRLHALVPCAGVGLRAQANGPKQYADLEGRPVVMHTLDALLAVPRLARILVVVAPGDGFLPVPDARVEVADCGGVSRAQSVFNGVERLLESGADPADWVLVHDAARCLVAPALVEALIDACIDDPVGGLLALPVADTLKRSVEGRAAETIERSDKWLAQTPQMARLGLLHRALAARAPAFVGVTDEASALEGLGLRPRLVQGSPWNIKLTYPQDFVLARALLRSLA